jgi:uncharacterized protein (UPF0332 family)
LEWKARLEGARQALDGAKVLLAHGDFRGCVSRCYYAIYQAMWAAVGAPKKKPRWEHLGIMKTFVRGSWFNPNAEIRGPGVFERYRFPLRRLYDLRLGADYRLDNISQDEAQWAVQITQEIVALAEPKDVRHETNETQG